MKRALICFIICTIILLINSSHGEAQNSIVTVPSDKSVYLYWRPADGKDYTYALYRIVKVVGAEYSRIATISRIKDQAMIDSIMKSATDPMSKSLTFNEDFHKFADENPGFDAGLSLSSTAYARIRGYAYLDEDVRADLTYQYRLMRIEADGKETLIGEVEVKAGEKVPLNAPSFTIRIKKDVPLISWLSTSYTSYEIYRAEKREGPYVNLTLFPIAAGEVPQPMTFDDKNAISDGRAYFYKIIPYDLFGQAGTESEIASIVTSDLTLPDPPDGFLTTGFPGGIRLSWDRSTKDKVAGYHLYRSDVEKSKGLDEKDRSRKRINTTPLSLDTTQYEDRSVIPGKVYLYEITAIDKKGDEGKFSPPALAAPRDFVPPARPSGLTGVTQEGGKVVLTWNANRDRDLYAYRIYQGTGIEGKLHFAREIKKEVLKEKAKGKITYEEKLDPRSQDVYSYAISAVDETENESPLTDTIYLRLPDHVPPVVPIITDLQTGDGYIEVSWGFIPEPDLAGYNVYRQEEGGKPVRLNEKAVPYSVSAYRDEKVVPGLVYLYSASSVDTSGNESQPSESRSTSTFKSFKTLPPSGLRIREVLGGAGAVLSWNAPKGARGVMVYSSRERDRDFMQVGEMVIEGSLKLHIPSDGSVWYRVQTVYENGEASEMSEPVEVKGKKERGLK